MVDCGIIRYLYDAVKRKRMRFRWMGVFCDAERQVQALSAFVMDCYYF